MNNNYPDGLNPADPNCPWNEKEPWVGQTCGTCRFYTQWDEEHFCLFEPMTNDIAVLLPLGSADEKDCEAWEGRE